MFSTFYQQWHFDNHFKNFLDLPQADLLQNCPILPFNHLKTLPSPLAVAITNLTDYTINWLQSIFQKIYFRLMSLWVLLVELKILVYLPGVLNQYYQTIFSPEVMKAFIPLATSEMFSIYIHFKMTNWTRYHFHTNINTKSLGLCKIDSWDWKLFSFVLHMMSHHWWPDGRY